MITIYNVVVVVIIIIMACFGSEFIFLKLMNLLDSW
jgi:hypothetical protein